MEPNVSAPTLAESAVARLREKIVSGEIPAGARLAEAVVAQGLGVSRVPVREALVRLERDGFVEFSPTGRARVKELSPGDFEELFTLRLALEPLAAKLAAPVLRADLTNLERNIEKTRRAKSVREVTCLDLEFHELILHAAGNSRLHSLWCSLRGELELWLGLLHRQHQTRTRVTRGETVRAHLEILEGFANESPPVCERILRGHILGWRDWLPSLEEAEA